MKSTAYDAMKKGIEGTTPAKPKTRSKLYNTLDYSDVYEGKKKFKKTRNVDAGMSQKTIDLYSEIRL